MGQLLSNPITSSNDNLETFSLLWLDASANTSPENMQATQELRNSIHYLKVFEDPNQCEKYIRSTADNDRIVLIVSGQLGKEIVPRIHHFPQLVSIYVYCQNQQLNEQWSRQYSKVHGVVTHLRELIGRIKFDQEKREKSRIYESLPISIFDPKIMHEKLTTDLHGNLVQSQLLINSLLKMQTNDGDKNELISISKQVYKNNKDELKTIDEFSKNYQPKLAIWWYTRDTFLSRLLNKALRTQNVDLLFLLQFFIVHIRQQLETNPSKSRIKVYRSQLMSKDELKKLSNAVGQFISINSFFSATKDVNRALSFLQINDGLEAVLFEINADPQLSSDKPFADIQHLSYNREEEVLFMLGSSFEMTDVKLQNNGLWIVQLKLCSTNSEQLDSINDKEKLIAFGHVLMTTGKVEEAEIYYQRILESMASNNPDRALYYEALGGVAVEKHDYDRALRSHQQALKINMERSDKKHLDIASNYNSIGEVYRKKGDHEKALEYYNKALKILDERSTGKELAKRAVCLNNIGIVYQEQQEYTEALNYYNQAFEIRNKHFQADETSLGMSYNNIGSIYYVLRDYDKALDNYRAALKMYKRTLPPNHIKFASTYNNIGAIYDDQNKLNEALECYNDALKIYRNIYSDNHPNVVKIQENIQRISNKMT